jgi:hypothetical protein
MNKDDKEGLNVACPTCEAMPGKRCELNIGGLRNSSHLERRWVELENKETGKKKSRAASAGGQSRS